MQVSELSFLIVDDHDFQRGMLVRLLSRLGAVNIAEAGDGAAALSLCTSASPPIDIIVCDLDMPGMDGMAFIRHLGESGISASLILSSALDRALVSSVGTMTRAYGINLLGTVEKPTTAEQLRALIALHEAPRPARPTGSTPRYSEDQIRTAIQARQFEPMFQPKVEIATGRLRGVEALARWHHPESGLVLPASFIGPIESAGLIDELSWLMVEQSAASCRVWREQGLDVSVAVNVSLASLNRPHFADRITDLVRNQGLDPRHMILEVTENTAMTNVAQALENLARFRVKGFGLAIDDYGTGYSSMQQLTRVPFTELKIDQSFVTGATSHEACRVVLESSLEIARKLHLRCVAEGVETLQDWDLLRRLGCDLAQGYLVARPMAAADLPQWARDWVPPLDGPSGA